MVSIQRIFWYFPHYPIKKGVAVDCTGTPLCRFRQTTDGIGRLGLVHAAHAATAWHTAASAACRALLVVFLDIPATKASVVSIEPAIEAWRRSAVRDG